MRSSSVTVQGIAAEGLKALGRSFNHPLSLFGWSLILVWCAWWINNLIDGRMLFAEHTWFRHPAFGVDYLFTADGPMRTWVAGGDPYSNKHNNWPPIVIRLFIWADLTTPGRALRIWVCVAALFAAIGAFAAVRTRRELDLWNLPFSVASAAILFSTPVLFALERANYDLLIIPLIVGAAQLMRSKRAIIAAEALAGLFLAVAIWAKLYPGLLILGVLALRRWRVAGWIAAFGALIGLSFGSQLLPFLENARAAAAEQYDMARAMPDLIVPWNHPLGLVWPGLWAGTPLALLPGELGAALLLAPLLAWVSWRIYTCPGRRQLALPYLFWVVALGSFVPAIANDYNLTPLLLAVLAIWNPRDRWGIHLALAALVLWWQPIGFPISGRIVLFIKLAGLIGLAGSFLSRASELSFRKSR